MQSSEIGKGFIFDHRTGYVYLVNKTGIHIFQHLKDGKTVDQIVDSLCAQFGLDREIALSDTEEFLENLVSEGLLVAEE
jgi:PqqD family protein of HPr-rel-A system